MNRRTFLTLAGAVPAVGAAAPARRTEVAIRGERFFLNGKPTYAGRSYRGLESEGLLNLRAVLGIFDDLNPETRGRWAYPDTSKWDPERNTREFVAALPEWRRHGLLAFTINLQGGSPEGYFKSQPARVLAQADALGMVAIVGYFYFAQDQQVKDEAAVRRAVTNATNWLLERDYRNVLVEIDNECDSRSYDHGILKAARVHELIGLVKKTRRGGCLGRDWPWQAWRSRCAGITWRSTWRRRPYRRSSLCSIPSGPRFSATRLTERCWRGS